MAAHPGIHVTSLVPVQEEVPMDPSGHPGLLLIPEWGCYACGVCKQYANSTDPEDSHRKSTKHVNAMARLVAPHTLYYLKPDCDLSNFHGMKPSQLQEASNISRFSST